MIVVLLVAAGAAWEMPALASLAGHGDMVVLKRCVDVDDLLAAASSGQAQVAVVGLDAPGLDAGAVDHLRHHGVRTVAVIDAERGDAARVRAARVGIVTIVAESDLVGLPDAVVAAHLAQAAPTPVEKSAPVDTSAATATPTVGRIVAVWGPAGAPGRSTVAAAVAAALAGRGRRTILVDADPYGGSVAQQLGIMDEVSGLLAAARLATSGQLDERFESVQRGIDAHLFVVTGLPRPDRWVEVRNGTIEHLLEVARGHGDVVVDTGFCLEDDPGHDYGSRPARNQLTRGALEVADVVIVIGGADPVGLSRLARGLVDLRGVIGVVGSESLHVVINRMRPTLGWSERDISGMIASFASPASVHFLPEDRTAVDRALVAGRTLSESGESALSRAVDVLVEAVLPGTPRKVTSRRVSSRRAGTGRRS